MRIKKKDLKTREMAVDREEKAAATARNEAKLVEREKQQADAKKKEREGFDSEEKKAERKEDRKTQIIAAKTEREGEKETKAADDAKKAQDKVKAQKKKARKWEPFKKLMKKVRMVRNPTGLENLQFRMVAAEKVMNEAKKKL